MAAKGGGQYWRNSNRKFQVHDKSIVSLLIRAFFSNLSSQTLLLNPTRLKAAGGGAAAEGGDAAGAGARCQDPLVVIPNTVSGKRYTALSTTFFSLTQKKKVSSFFPLVLVAGSNCSLLFFFISPDKRGSQFPQQRNSLQLTVMLSSSSPLPPSIYKIQLPPMIL